MPQQVIQTALKMLLVCLWDGSEAVHVCVCRVAPVYRHIFPLSTAPTLSIIGLPWKVVPFPEFEVQAKWIARVLSQRVHLPSMEAMQAEVQQFYAELDRQEVPARCGQLPQHAVLPVL